MKSDPISKYAVKETKLRLQRFSKNLRHGAKHPEDPEAIHDLRVSIRRVVQAFKTFGELLDPAPVKKLRRRFHKVMDLCAEVRICVVGLVLLEEVGITTGASVSRLKKVRDEAAEKLHRSLKKEHHNHHAAPDRSFSRIQKSATGSWTRAWKPICPAPSPRLRRNFSIRARPRSPPMPTIRSSISSASKPSGSATPWSYSSLSMETKWREARGS